MMPQSDPDDTLEVIPDFEIESLARCLLPVLQAFYDSPEGQAAFERWKNDNSNDTYYT